MANRRAFLASLGVGIGGLGLPGLARAFGRRRRCKPCAAPCPPPCGPVPCGRVPSALPSYGYTAQTLCPQTRTFVNGIYYYGALDSSNNCANTNFTSGNYYNVPVTCPNSSPPCITVLRSTAPSVKHGSRTANIPHHVQGLKSVPPSHPRLCNPLDPDPKKVKFEDSYGNWEVRSSQLCNVTLPSGGSRLVLLMRLQSDNYPTDPRIYVLPVGQEVSGSAEAVTRPANDYYPDEDYCTVDYDSVTYDVILLRK